MKKTTYSSVSHPDAPIPEHILKFKGQCRNCEFYFSGICANEFYGEDVTKTKYRKKPCYTISLNQFTKLMKTEEEKEKTK
jgi:hypothetical protein